MDEYDRLLEAARHNPEKADFFALRMAYVRSPLFNPYITMTNTMFGLRSALQQDSIETIGAGLQAVLRDDYLDIETHAFAFRFYEQNGQASKAVYHRQFMHGLLDSIIRVDGRTPETAFRVITIREEYAVMGALGMPVETQRKASLNGSHFDILTSRHPRLNQPVDLYFNIDLMRSYFRDVLPH